MKRKEFYKAVVTALTDIAYRGQDNDSDIALLRRNVAELDRKTELIWQYIEKLNKNKKT